MDIHACGRYPAVGALVVGKVCQNVARRLGGVVREVRRQRRHGQVADVRVAVALGAVVEHQFTEEGRAEGLAGLGVFGSEDVGGEVVGVDAVVPPLRQTRVRALEPAGEGVGGAAQAGEGEGRRGDGDGAVGGCVGRVFGEGFEGDFDVAEAMEAVGADFAAVLAVELVGPGIFGGLDCYLARVSIWLGLPRLSSITHLVGAVEDDFVYCL
jgi:hypothetical protein